MSWMSASEGFALGHVVGDLDDGDAMINRALALNPNWALAWLYSGWVRVWRGEPEEAIERVARAMRLSPHDPRVFNMQGAIAYAHFIAGRYAEALSWAEMALREQPDFATAIRILAASCALTGRQEQAEKAMAHLRELDPAFRISKLKQIIPLRRPDDFARMAEGLRKAGLPE